MKKKRAIVITVICVCLCVGYYFYLTNRSSGKEEDLTEVQKLISMDLSLTHPKTPREVVKLYNRIEKCLYEEEYTEEEFKSLGMQARNLMDKDLQANNPEDQYLLLLKSEIETFKDEGKSIVRIGLSSGNEVEYEKREGYDCAYVGASYFIKVKKSTERTNQTFILRKSDENKWMILGIYQ